MEEQINPTAVPQEEEEKGLDIMAIVRQLWTGRKTIIICTVVFLVLGLVAAFTMKRTYSVSTVMVPQLSSKSSTSSLSSLASLAGFDLGSASSGAELSPLIYPQIVNSVPFRLAMIHTPLPFAKSDTLISMYDYAMAGYEKPGVMSVILKYTIGLPGVIMGAIRGEEPEVTMPAVATKDNDAPKPLVVSKREQKVLDGLSRMIMLDVDKKEGYVTLSVTGTEPAQVAELALKAQKLLQDEVTRFRVEKSQGELEYIEARYEEAKEESDRYQMALATATDRSQYVTTTSAGVGKARIQSKYNVANAVYMELAKQLEQAKMQVKKETPVFAIIQPVTMPTKPSNSRSKTIIVWLFFGIIVGCGIVIGKGYWPKVKGMFSSASKDAEEEQQAEATA